MVCRRLKGEEDILRENWGVVLREWKGVVLRELKECGPKRTEGVWS